VLQSVWAGVYLFYGQKPLYLYSKDGKLCNPPDYLALTEYMMNNYENLDYSDITYEVTDYRIDNDKNIKLYIEYQLNISNLDPDIDFPRVMPITLVKENKKCYVFDFARVAYYEGTDGYIHVFETYY